jgi:hypothetical protein
VAQWLYRTFGCSIEEATHDSHWIFIAACGQGFLETAQWLNATFLFFTRTPEIPPGQAKKLTFATTYAGIAFKHARRYGHAEVAAWLLNTFCVFI